MEFVESSSGVSLEVFVLPLLQNKTMTATSKVQLGQFYTQTNPFTHPTFREWLSSIPNISKRRFLEPFGGSNNIIEMILDVDQRVQSSNWASFDIQPQAQAKNRVPAVRVSKKNTIKHFPVNYDVVITNPPYLAKNSATRKGAEIDLGGYGDLFELSLDRMLSNAQWVAAIIPESFITRGVFHDRLEFVISLNTPMFADTEFPVCLAAFGPENSTDFDVWLGSQRVGSFSELSQRRKKFESGALRTFKFNQMNGRIGLRAVDGTKKASIEFIDGSHIDPNKVKYSSRALTRIDAPFLSDHETKELIRLANKELSKYRSSTHDIFLTSFKGLRLDGQYRRRLDWATANQILNVAYAKLIKNSK